MPTAESVESCEGCLAKSREAGGLMKFGAQNELLRSVGEVRFQRALKQKSS